MKKKRTRSDRRRSGLLAPIRIWLAQHAQACLFSLGQIAKNPFGSFLTVAVIGVTLSLPAGFYLLLDNFQRLANDWGGSVQITLFLQQEVDAAAAQQLLNELTADPAISTVRLIDREQALAEFRRHSGFAEALDGLEENPLPHVLVLKPEDKSIAAGAGERLLEKLEQMEKVDSAQFDRQWARRLFAMLELVQRGVTVLSSLLALAVLLIIGNTIRLAIYNRREEIAINRLFGATDAFIRRPFLYSGLIHGLGGSIMAWLLLAASMQLLETPVLQLSSLYQSDFRLLLPGFRPSLVLIGSGGALGLAGSWIAFQRHLRAIGLT